MQSLLSWIFFYCAGILELGIVMVVGGSPFFREAVGIFSFSRDRFQDFCFPMNWSVFYIYEYNYCNNVICCITFFLD